MSLNKILLYTAILPAVLVGHAQAGAQDVTVGSAPTIMVVGSPHLRAQPSDAVPVALSAIRQSLLRYAPDHVVVEWLHPSIDPSSVFNYRTRGDFDTLAKLWGIPLNSVTPRLERTQSALVELESHDLPTAALRLYLGKLYYLSNDQLNAGYQWWRAAQLGAEVSDLYRLTGRNFEGHELREFGFEIAAARDLEYVTPFDYQGPEAGTEIWGVMLDRLATRAVHEIDAVEPGDDGYASAVAQFDSLRRAFERNDDPGLESRFGSVQEVAEYIETWRGFGRENSLRPQETDGLTLFHWLQSEAYEKSERRIQRQLIPNLSIGGLGEARWRGIHRRNELMADFAEADIHRFEARRVLIIVGAGHKFDLEDIFEERGYHVVASSEYVP